MRIGKTKSNVRGVKESSDLTESDSCTSCGYCGESIPSVNRYGHQRKYCSRQCKNMAWQKRHGWCNNLKAYEDWKSRGSNHKGKVLTCAVCGDEFSQTASHQKYCGESCSRVQEYFVKRYGADWRLARNRFHFVTELAAFKREVKDGT